MENLRIIQLNPNTFISSVATFDEVFDEYSEARGDRRAKRTARKVERQQAKGQVQQARAERKQAQRGVKTARKEDRQLRKTGISDMRQARRTGRSEQRQDRKAGRSAATQQRRTDRRASTLDRRAMGEELEPELQDEILDENIDERGYNEEEQQYVPQGGGAYEGETFEDERVDDLNYEDNGRGSNYEQSFQDNFGDANYQEEPQYDGYDFGDEYDSYSNDEPENDFNFDGSLENSDDLFDTEQASQIIKIPSEITVTADCIEWNKELYSRLDGKKKEIIATQPQTNLKPYDDSMQMAANRIAELEDYLNGWANCKYNYKSDNSFEAFPNLDNDFSNADGQTKMAKIKRGRAKRVKMAKANAKRKRDKVTLVKTKLNPIIESNKIVIPSSSFEGIPKGTGLIGLDDSNDYDAPNELDIELTSNASGTNKVNINAILIGVGLAAIGIYAIKKFNLFK